MDFFLTVIICSWIYCAQLLFACVLHIYHGTRFPYSFCDCIKLTFFPYVLWVYIFDKDKLT